MPYIESYHEFLARHGVRSEADLAMIRSGAWLLPDGAQVLDRGNGPQFFDPPAEPLQRLQAQRGYWRTRAELFEDSFTKLKAALLGAVDGFQWRAEFGPDPGDGKAALLQLRALASDARRHEAALIREIEAHPAVKAQREKEAEQRHWEAERRDRELTRRREIEEIELERVEVQTVESQTTN